MLSLALMVFLANVPVGADLFGYGSNVTFSVSASSLEEPLPAITIHEIPEERQQRSRADLSITESSSSPKADDVKSEEVRESGERPPTRLPFLRPAALTAATTLPNEEDTRNLLRITAGPPSVDVPPKVRVGSMIVRYPISALRKAIQGLVIVRFTVEPSGRASSIEIVKGLDPACDEEVLEAVERARFMPGKRKGRNVPAYSQMTVRFVLAEAEPGNAY